MVRNLRHLKRRPKNPTRSCLKRTGPGEMILIQTEIKPMTGNKTGDASKMQTRSRPRFQGGMGAAGTNGSETVKVACCISTRARNRKTECSTNPKDRQEKTICGSNVYWALGAIDGMLTPTGKAPRNTARWPSLIAMVRTKLFKITSKNCSIFR